MSLRCVAPGGPTSTNPLPMVPTELSDSRIEAIPIMGSAGTSPFLDDEIQLLALVSS